VEISGKQAFVTGGSGDIGTAITKALALAGANVAVSYLGSAERAHATIAAVNALGRKSAAFQLDQRDQASIDACCNRLAETFGQVDILVNNAGWNIGIPFSDLKSLTAEIWDRILETNLRGPYLLSRALAPELRRNGAGRIVNIASLAGVAPGGSSIAYAASKAGLIHLTHCLAVALAPDVTVNCVAPGLVEGTRMAARVPEEVKRRSRSLAVLGRTGSAQDIAAQVVAFCRADTITGQVVVVDGGNPTGMR